MTADPHIEQAVKRAQRVQDEGEHLRRDVKVWPQYAGSFTASIARDVLALAARLEAAERDLADAREDSFQLRRALRESNYGRLCMSLIEAEDIDARLHFTIPGDCALAVILHLEVAEMAALAAAKQPPNCTCQSSWPSDMRCPACEAAVQQPPAEETP